MAADLLLEKEMSDEDRASSCTPKRCTRQLKAIRACGQLENTGALYRREGGENDGEQDGTRHAMSLARTGLSRAHGEAWCEVHRLVPSGRTGAKQHTVLRKSLKAHDV